MHVVRKNTENSIIILCMCNCKTNGKYQNVFYLLIFNFFIGFSKTFRFQQRRRSRNNRSKDVEIHDITLLYTFV
jgi:hypothetical protein